VFDEVLRTNWFLWLLAAGFVMWWTSGIAKAALADWGTISGKQARESADQSAKSLGEAATRLSRTLEASTVAIVAANIVAARMRMPAVTAAERRASTLGMRHLLELGARAAASRGLAEAREREDLAAVTELEAALREIDEHESEYDRAKTIYETVNPLSPENQIKIIRMARDLLVAAELENSSNRVPFSR
jgi:hypothetical protein